MTSTSASSDTVTIATHIELIRCDSTVVDGSETPFVTPTEKRTEVVVMTSRLVWWDLLDIIWHNVMQQWSRSGFLELPRKDFDAYGHILRVCYVLQGGSRERSHDIFDYNLDRTLEFLKSGTTTNTYLQFYFWPSLDQKSESASPAPLPLEDRDYNNGQSEISHTSERQIEITLETQNDEEDEVESQLQDQIAHCLEDPRVDSAASSPVRGSRVHKDRISKVLIETEKRTEHYLCSPNWVESH